MRGRENNATWRLRNCGGSSYSKVSDAMRKSGVSTNEKDKCPVYDDLDSILDTSQQAHPLQMRKPMFPVLTTPT